jgi:Phage tail lysozyme
MTKFERIAAGYMRRLINDCGVTVLDAAAVFGNAGHESGGLESMQEISPAVKGSAGGYGWFQWTGPRRRAFMRFCAAHKIAPHEDESNYLFLVHELKNVEKTALPALRQHKTLKDKVTAFEMAYERAGVKHYDRRLAWAKKALAAYQRTGRPAANPDAAIPQPPSRWDAPLAKLAPDAAVTALIDNADKPGMSTTNIAAGIGSVSGAVAIGNEAAYAVSSAKDSLDMLLAAGPWILLLIVCLGAGFWIWRERQAKRRLGAAAREAVSA